MVKCVLVLGPLPPFCITPTILVYYRRSKNWSCERAWERGKYGPCLAWCRHQMHHIWPAIYPNMHTREWEDTYAVSWGGFCRCPITATPATANNASRDDPGSVPFRGTGRAMCVCCVCCMCCVCWYVHIYACIKEREREREREMDYSYLGNITVWKRCGQHFNMLPVGNMSYQH